MFPGWNQLLLSHLYVVSHTEFFKNWAFERPIATSRVFSCFSLAQSWSKWIFWPEIGLDSWGNIPKMSIKPPHAKKSALHTPPKFDKSWPIFHAKHQCSQEAFAIHNICRIAYIYIIILPNIEPYYVLALCNFLAQYTTEFKGKRSATTRLGIEYGPSRATLLRSVTSP